MILPSCGDKTLSSEILNNLEFKQQNTKEEEAEKREVFALLLLAHPLNYRKDPLNLC